MSVERLVVRVPNWLGDVCLSLPALRDVRRAFPAARIEVLGRRPLIDVYAAVREVDGVREARGFGQTVESLRGAFDAAVLFTNSFRSALEAFAARIPERWGYARDARSPLLTRKSRVPAGVRGKSEVYYYRAMLAGVGVDVSKEPDASLQPLPEWTARGGELLPDGERWIGLCPGAFFGSAKRWLPERYAAVGERLARRTGARVAIVGAAAERPLAEAIARQIGPRARVLCGETSLGELVGVLSRLQLLVSNDSGPMHLAAAVGTPVLAVFGPTDWRETAPFTPRHRLLRQAVHCAPCKLRECPIDHRCMRLVDVDRVAAAALELLAAGDLTPAAGPAPGN